MARVFFIMLRFIWLIQPLPKEDWFATKMKLPTFLYTMRSLPCGQIIFRKVINETDKGKQNEALAIRMAMCRT